MVLSDLVDGKLRCCTCQEYKDLGEYHNSKTGKHGKAGRCKVCACSNARKQHAGHRAKGAASHEAHRRGYRNAYYLRTYGITLEAFELMLHKQDSKCAICASELKPEGKQCNLDHCHTTGKIRGILCNNCNRGIGYLRDDEAILLSAAAYLQSHREWNE